MLFIRVVRLRGRVRSYFVDGREILGSSLEVILVEVIRV